MSSSDTRIEMPTWRNVETFLCTRGGETRHVEVREQISTNGRSGARLPGLRRVTVVAASGCVLHDVAALGEKEAQKETLLQLLAAQGLGFRIRPVAVS